MIFPLILKLKLKAIQHPMVSQTGFGDLSLYDNFNTVKYPYVNFDIVNSVINNWVKTYTIRVYVLDINNPLVAYSKAETIMDNIFKDLKILNYNVNYFTLNFKDLVNGIWADIEIQEKIVSDCDYTTLFNHQLLEDGSFRQLENGDLVIIV